MAKPWMRRAMERGRKNGFEKANAGFGRGFTYTVEPWERATYATPVSGPVYKRPKKRVRKPVRLLPDLTADPINPSIHPRKEEQSC